MTERIEVVDSHTEGEPTRVVIAGGPPLGVAPAAEQRRRLDTDFDDFRRAVVLEPRGHEAVVGALLLEATDPAHAAQVVFFNNRSTLGMCVHGTIGVAVTLAHLGRIAPGRHSLETPVGIVHFDLFDSGRVAVDNVRSFRSRRKVAVDTASHGRVHGDVAWGGNWFFLVEDHGLEVVFSNVSALRDAALDVHASLLRAGVHGDDGAEIDHVELFGPASQPGAHSRNFVLCPGGEYDRSPCGTGTSAKIACLAAEGLLGEGEEWVQESVVGTCFRGRYRKTEGGVLPRLEGRAWVTAESVLLRAADDPFRSGIRP